MMCRRTGLFIGNYFGSVTGPIWLSYLHCTGNETSLNNCTHNGWGVHYCWHGQDVSILCGGGGTLNESVSYILVGLLLLSLFSVKCQDTGSVQNEHNP